MNLRHRLILASNSPRRKNILAEAGFAFEIFTKPVEENYPHELPKNQVAKYLAEKKVKAYLDDFDDDIILTADTTVLLNNELLEKPSNEEEATEMLLKLSGTTHEVISGVAIAKAGKITSFDDTTTVTFRELTMAEISGYIRDYQPFDKAGGYGVQERIGYIGITAMKGSFFNVMGLPIHRVYDDLAIFQQ